MPDVFTSTTGKKLFVVIFEPNGDRLYVEAANAVSASQAAIGLAVAHGITHNGNYDTRGAVPDDLDHPKLRNRRPVGYKVKK